MAGLIHPTLTSNIGFGFGSVPFDPYEDRYWHGSFYMNFHGGIDYWGPLGYPIWASGNGTVLYAGWAVPYVGAAGGYGVVIAHGPNMKSIYGHMDTVTVTAGQQVTAGQRIGTMGESGIANGVIHLHFEIRTITPEWGEDVEDPAVLFEGGALATNYGYDTYDIPWIEPLSGVTVRMGLCILQSDGTYALPTGASSVVAVYFDRMLAEVSQYSILNVEGNLYIDPVEALGVEVEVRADYVA